MENCCDHCNGKEASHVCGSCKSVAYCGATCQSSHWENEHEKVCFNVNNPDMKHLTSLIGAEASKDDLMKEVHEALIESPNDPELQEIAVMMGQFLVNETAAEKYKRYMDKKSRGAKVSTRKGFKGKVQNLYYKGKHALDKWNLKRQGKNKLWKEQKMNTAPAVPARDDYDDITPEEARMIRAQRTPIKSKLYF